MYNNIDKEVENTAVIDKSGPKKGQTEHTVLWIHPAMHGHGSGGGTRESVEIMLDKYKWIAGLGCGE